MGMRFGKSFKLPGGFRVNLSKSGVGVSGGVKGARFGTGPRGNNLSLSIPGTGLGYTKRWPSGQGEREQQQSWAKQDREALKAIELEAAAATVAKHEGFIQQITSLHHEAKDPWDWSMVAVNPYPAEPAPGNAHESLALSALANHRQGFMAKLTDPSDRKRAQLAADVESAKHRDAAEHQAALALYQESVVRWQWLRNVAGGVLAGDLEACQAVLEHLGPFAELQQLGASLDVGIDRPWCAEAWFGGLSNDFIPHLSFSLTSTGKVSQKHMPTGRYWEIYQDYVCSAAFRIAREIFALLPIPVVFVHASVPLLDPSTGKTDEQFVLSVAFEREQFMSLDLLRIDPSDAVQAFEHAMVFNKKNGFRPIEPLSPEDANLVEA